MPASSSKKKSRAAQAKNKSTEFGEGPGTRGRWKDTPQAWKLKLDRRSKDAAPLCVQLREEIRRQIVEGVLCAGDPLMPQREMCRQFRINQVTATKAIGDLVAEGLLRSEHGRGIFVNDTSPPAVGMLCKSSTPQSSGYAAMVQAAADALTKANVRVEWITREKRQPGEPSNPHERFGPDLARVLEAKVDAFLAVGIQHNEYLATLVGSGRTVVALDAAPLGAEFDGVVVDSFRAGYLSARHLLMHGHRNLLFIGYDRGRHPGDPEGVARIPEPDAIKAHAGFEYARLEAGLPYAHEGACPYVPEAGSEEEARLEDLLARGAATGAVTSGQGADWLAARADIPGKLSVVRLGPAKSADRKWTYCTADEPALGEAAADRMLARLGVGGSGREVVDAARASALITLPPSLKDGKTVRRIGPAPELYDYHQVDG